MPKGVIPDRDAPTAAEKFRSQLRELEIGVNHLKGKGVQALDLLRLRDQLEVEIAKLAEEGMDVRPERTRLETVDNIFQTKAGTLNRELRSIGGLAGARQRENPPEDHLWWYGDIFLKERRRQALIRTAIGVVAVLVILLGVNWYMDRFHGYSPEEKRARSLMSDGERFIQAGQIEQAIGAYEQAVAILPQLGEAQAMLAVLYELQGRSEEAQQTFARAEAAYPSRGEYLKAVAKAYGSVGRLGRSLELLNEDLALNPKDAEAYYIRAGVYEMLDRVTDALRDLDTCAKLASEQKLDALYVLAKQRYGILVQRGAGM